MLKKFLVAVLGLAVVLAIVGVFMPTGFQTTRSVVIHADRAKIHDLVGDLRAWDSWAPWKEEDPTIVTTFGPITDGVGAHQRWTGKDGAGRLTLTECDPATGIRYDMAFIDGERESASRSWMLYRDRDGGTEVTWGIEGNMNVPVIGGYIALAVGRSIGPMFERGLGKLKAVAEGP